MIQKTFLLLSIITILGACCNEKDKLLFYVIKPQKLKENQIPVFYSDKNFILYNDTTIYFHDKFVTYSCGTGIDFSKPSKLYLQPDTLKTVKLASIKTFLDSISKIPSDRNKQLILIASPKDTIRNQALLAIRNYYRNKKNTLVGIRKCTEEETYVSNAKFMRSPYDSSKCKWKIGFGDEMPNEVKVLKFLPPIEK